MRSDSSSKKKQKLTGGDAEAAAPAVTAAAASVVAVEKELKQSKGKGKGGKLSVNLALTPVPADSSSKATNVGSNSNSNSNGDSNSNKKRKRNDDGEIADTAAKNSVTVTGLKKWKIKPNSAESGILIPKPTMKTNKANGLAITEYIVGKGELPREGAKIKLVYEGYFPDGTLFDSKLKHSDALVFRRGIGQVIKGLDLGVDGMRIGGSREITVPAALG